jgi:hypothetical protein
MYEMNEQIGNNQLIEKLAEAAHKIFCEHLFGEGYKNGPVTSESQKTHSSLKPYDELPEYEKEQNRGTVRDIPQKLAILGYTLEPVVGRSADFSFTHAQIEKLSEEEHRRWMDQKLGEGWQYALETDKAAKKHKDLVPWEQLREADKEKDRVIVKGIPAILDRAGLRVRRET